MPVIRRLAAQHDRVNNNSDVTVTPAASNAVHESNFSNVASGPSTSPAKMKAAKSHARKREDGHIPRPRNAFIIFRSEFVAKGIVPMSVETHSQNLSRIAGQVWKSMSPSERMIWFNRAAEEKALHAEKYPGYQYHPTDPYTLRNKRKVRKSRGKTELKVNDIWCTEVAGLLVQGAEGDELKEAMRDLEKRTKASILDSDDSVIETPKTDSPTAGSSKVSPPSPLDSRSVETATLDSVPSHPLVSSGEIVSSSPPTLAALTPSNNPDSPQRVVLPPLRYLPPLDHPPSPSSRISTLKQRPLLPFPGALIVPDKPRSSTSPASSPGSSITSRSELSNSTASAFRVPDYFTSASIHRPQDTPVRFGETWCPR